MLMRNTLLQSSWGKYDLQLSKHTQTEQAMRVTGLQFHAQTPHSTDALFNDTTLHSTWHFKQTQITPTPPPKKKKGKKNWVILLQPNFINSARSLFLLE